MAIKSKSTCCTPNIAEMETKPREPSSASVSRASYTVKHALIDLIDPEFLMGDAFGEGYDGDGEGPQRLAIAVLASFLISLIISR